MIGIPGYIDKEAWDGFEEMRRLIKKPLTDEQALSIAMKAISYNQTTGEFWRKFKLAHNSSDRADRKIKLGYMVVNVCGRRVYAHRLAWAMVHGSFPDAEIDHINGDREDNRLENLRLATRAQNCGNVAKRTGKTGLFGVQKPPHTSRYRSSITFKSKRLHIGYFGTPEEAHEAALRKLDEVRKEFSPSSRVRAK